MKHEKRGMSDKFGILLKSFRVKQNLTIRELAERSNVTASYINRLENGQKRRPSQIIVEDLAYALGIDPITFLDIDKRGKNNSSKNLHELFFLYEVSHGERLLSAKEKEVVIQLIDVALEVKWSNETMLENIKEIGELVSVLKEC